MNLNLPGVGLGRGRVWRSNRACMAGSQPTKPWLGTLNSGELGRRMSGRCVWAEGHELPYIQQGIMSDSCGDSLGDFRLPSPTSPTASRDWDRVTSRTTSPLTSDRTASRLRSLAPRTCYMLTLHYVTTRYSGLRQKKTSRSTMAISG